jgi:hypothetical protein
MINERGEEVMNNNNKKKRLLDVVEADRPLVQLCHYSHILNALMEVKIENHRYHFIKIDEDD